MKLNITIFFGVGHGGPSYERVIRDIVK